MQRVKHYERNMAGRDFAVGDIHGCFTQMAAALATLEFDDTRDRLFSVRDLVDRGPESELVLEWLAKDWFHPVQGNHEDLAIRYVEPGNRDPEHYMMNGGAWLIGKTRAEQVEYADALATLPYAIDVRTEHGLVGIVHAECACPTWSEMVERFGTAKSNNQRKAVTDTCLWSRDRIMSEDRTVVPDVVAVIVGHTPLQRPAVLGNTYFIDTGGWHRTGTFTFIDLATLKALPAMPMALRFD